MGNMAGAIGQYQKAEADREAAQRNAQEARWMAADALAQGSVQAQDMKMRGGRFRGAITAAAAGSGIDVSSGSVIATQETTAGMTALDVVRILNNAARKAYGYKIQARAFEDAKDAAQMNKTLALVAAGTSVGTWLGGAAMAGKSGGEGYDPGATTPQNLDTMRGYGSMTSQYPTIGGV